MHDESCELCGSAREAKLRKAGHRIEMLTNIRRDGYHKMGVFSETEGEPEFSYTVGLFHTYEHPEVIIFGLEIDAEFAVLHTVQELVANGMMFSHGDESFEVLDGTSVVFVDFSRVKYDEYLGQAENFYQSDDFPVLMLVWPDRDGVFPWSDGAADWLSNASRPYGLRCPRHSHFGSRIRDMLVGVKSRTWRNGVEPNVAQACDALAQVFRATSKLEVPG